MAAPIICFGQQPCGFFPKRFLYAKIVTARQLQQEIGGEIVFFFHDSDHDPRETITILRERHSGREHRVNFRFLNSIQKEFSPLYAKRILPDWHSKMVRQLPSYVDRELVDKFQEVDCHNPADFCLKMYGKMGLLDGVRSPLLDSGVPLLRADEVAGAILAAARDEGTGQAWVVQPGREPLVFRFPNVPGPRS